MITCENNVEKHLDDLDVQFAEGAHTVQPVLDAILQRVRVIYIRDWDKWDQ